MITFDFARLPADIQVELTSRRGSRIGEVACVGRKRERNPSQVIHAHLRGHGYCCDLGNLHCPFAHDVAA